MFRSRVANNDRHVTRGSHRRAKSELPGLKSRSLSPEIAVSQAPSASVEWQRAAVNKWIPPVLSNIAFTQHDGAMYIFGGISLRNRDGRSNVIAKVDLAHPDEGWKQLLPAVQTATASVRPAARSSAAICGAGSKLWMFGGEGSFQTKTGGKSAKPKRERETFNELYSFDLKSNTWSLHATTVRAPLVISPNRAPPAAASGARALLLTFLSSARLSSRW